MRRILLTAIVGSMVFVLHLRYSEAVDESFPCDPEPTSMFIAYGDVVTCSLETGVDTDVFRFSGVPPARALRHHQP